MSSLTKTPASLSHWALVTHMPRALKASVPWFPFQTVLYRNLSLMAWVANAGVLRRERKSRATQDKDHEIRNTCLGENSTQNTDPPAVPPPRSCRLSGLLCAGGAKGVTSQGGDFERDWTSQTTQVLLPSGVLQTSLGSKFIDQCSLSRSLGPPSPAPLLPNKIKPCDKCSYV